MTKRYPIESQALERLEALAEEELERLEALAEEEEEAEEAAEAADAADEADTDEYEHLGLTEDELAALREGEEPEPVAQVRNGAPEKGGAPISNEDLAEADDDDASPARADQGGAEGAKASSDAGETAAQDAASGDQGDTAEPFSRDRVPVRYAEGTIEEVDEQAATLKSERAQIREKFRDGEIDDEEYDEQLELISERTRALDAQRIRIELSEANAAHQWADDNATFFAAHTDYADSPLLQGALQAQLHLLALEPAWQGRRAGLSMLEAARTAVDRELGRAGAQTRAPEPEPAPPEASRRDALAGRGKAREKLPTTLAGVPAAEASSASGEARFESLDQLEGQAFEAALAALSEAEVQRYLESDPAH